MCGRFALTATEDEINSHFDLTRGFIMKPRYNIAPSQLVVAIRHPRAQAEFFRWGFVPQWLKPQAGSKISSYINARSETAHEKPVFRQAFNKQRCIIPATGYYEWKAFKDLKQPYFLTSLKGGMFGLAGIWDKSMSESGESIETCAILTKSAPPEVQHIHDRMPVILAQKDYDAWFSVKTPLSKLQEIIQKESMSLEAYPVSTKVNNPRFDASVCIKRL